MRRGAKEAAAFYRVPYPGTGRVTGSRSAKVMHARGSRLMYA